MHDRSRRPGNTTRITENQDNQIMLQPEQPRTTRLCSNQSNQGQPDCAQTTATKGNQNLWKFEIQNSKFFVNVLIMHYAL